MTLSPASSRSSTAPTLRGCRVCNDANQACVTTGTALTFNREDGGGFDTDGYHSIASNTSRITIPAGLAGYYQVDALVRPAVSGTQHLVSIQKSGGGVDLARVLWLGTAGGNISGQLTAIVNLAVADYIELIFSPGANINSETNSTASAFCAPIFQAVLLGT